MTEKIIDSIKSQLGIVHIDFYEFDEIRFSFGGKEYSIKEVKDVPKRQTPGGSKELSGNNLPLPKTKRTARADKMLKLFGKAGGRNKGFDGRG